MSDRLIGAIGDFRQKHDSPSILRRNIDDVVLIDILLRLWIKIVILSEYSNQNNLIELNESND